EKGYVERRRTKSAHTFAATVGRDELIGRRLQDVAEKLCGGSLTPLLTHLVRSRPLSAQERDELRALIDELDSKKRGKGTSPWQGAGDGTLVDGRSEQCGRRRRPGRGRADRGRGLPRARPAARPLAAGPAQAAHPAPGAHPDHLARAGDSVDGA